jgi:aryl-alcohol dehydrogenase-like predicted oxidoreductase
MEYVAGDDPFVAVQHPVSPIDAAKPRSFTTGLIPELLEKGYAVMGMKPFAHGRMFANNKDRWETDDPIIPNHLSVEEVIWYNLSQPITSMVCGTDELSQVGENISAVRKFARLSIREQQYIVAKLDKFTGVIGLEYYRPDPETN